MADVDDSLRACACGWERVSRRPSRNVERVAVEFGFYLQSTSTYVTFNFTHTRQYTISFGDKEHRIYIQHWHQRFSTAIHTTPCQAQNDEL